VRVLDEASKEVLLSNNCKSTDLAGRLKNLRHTKKAEAFHLHLLAPTARPSEGRRAGSYADMTSTKKPPSIAVGSGEKLSAPEGVGLIAGGRLENVDACSMMAKKKCGKAAMC